MAVLDHRQETPRRWGRATALHPSYAEFYQRSAYAGFQHETRTAGSMGTQLLKVRQGGHGLTDLATPDLLVGIRQRVEPAPARYNLGDRWIPIPTDAPHTVVAPPLTDVDYRIEGESALIILATPVHRLAPAVDCPGLIERLAPVYETPFRDPLVEALGARSWAAAGRQDGLFVDSATVTVLSILMARADDRHGIAARPEPGPALRVSRVVDFIEAHLADDLSLLDLAAVACLSPFHFARVFKARLGISPLRFVQRRRVARAQHLLASPGIRLIDIAHQCGFSDQAHFTTVFRRVTGVAPGAWRASREG